MTHGQRSIAFIAELIHPPAQHTPQALQQLHGQVFGNPVCSYRDFRLVAGGAQFTNHAPGLPGAPVSMATVMNDRIQIREEQTGASRDDFADRMRAFSQLALSNLGVQMLLVQQFAVRTVVNPDGAQDAREFVLGTVLGYDETLLSAFPAAPSLGGLRFTFPPVGELQGVYNVRIESFSQDARALFLENVGTFGRPITATALDELDDRFGATYDFLQDNVLGFVQQFDGEDLS